MKTIIVITALFTLLLESCSTKVEHTEAWTAQPKVQGLVPIPTNEVLIVDQAPSTSYTKVGTIDGPVGADVPFNPGDQMEFFKETAAAMGGNTVVITPASNNGPTKLNVLYVREEVGTHGGDDF